MRRLLHAEVLEDGHAALGRGDAAGDGADVVLGQARPGAPVVDRDPRHLGAHLVEAGGVLGQPPLGEQALVDEDGQQGAEGPGVGPGTDLQVVVGQVGGLRAPGVEHDQRAVGVVGHGLEDGPGAGEAVGLPRVLAHEDEDLGLLPVTGRVAAGSAVELSVDPELAGLLLGQGVGLVLRAEGGAGGPPVGAAQVVPLAAAPVVEDRLAAVGGPHVVEAGGDLGDRRVPVDLLEGPVGAPAQRGRQPVAAVLVVVEAQGLLARVARAGGVGLVAPDPLERPPVVTAEAHLDAAVDRAEDARRLVPLRHDVPFRVSSMTEPSREPVVGQWQTPGGDPPDPHDP